MTRQKHLKDRIRARMQKTGERYTVARRNMLAKLDSRVADGSSSNGSCSEGPERFHFPGNVPATTALRVLLSAANSHHQSAQPPLSEAMLFGIAGGVGAGVFAFRYEQDDFSSFYVAGRHVWQDDLAYLQSACTRLGAQVEIEETGGAKAAEKQLRDALRQGGPVVAWVDMALLPRHASPHQSTVGGQYHVVTAYGIDDTKSEALIGDLADGPDSVPLQILSESRMRIKKQKNRLVRVSHAPREFDIKKAVIEGITACHDALVGKGAVKPPGGKAMAKNFTLDAFSTWADRLHGGSDKQSWATMFPRGLNFWRGLTSVYSFIHYGTGGGLSRPLYAEFFREVEKILGVAGCQELSERYQKLGDDWDTLGEAALPENVGRFRRFRELSAERAELTLSGGKRAAERIQEIVLEFRDLERSAQEKFPLNENECDDLRAELQRHCHALHLEEVAAHQRLGEVVAAEG
ncbi:BtrH N-terminal domain-containing protein [Planctomycetaceae bacterium SH139]